MLANSLLIFSPENNSKPILFSSSRLLVFEGSVPEMLFWSFTFILTSKVPEINAGIIIEVTQDHSLPTLFLTSVLDSEDLLHSLNTSYGEVFIISGWKFIHFGLLRQVTPAETLIGLESDGKIRTDKIKFKK